MKILAIETSSEACSAALGIDGEIRERYEIAPRRHGALILPMIDSLMNEASITFNQLDAVAFGRGPGSFMGVRIASGVTQGIAFAADLPVVPVSSLAAIAQNTRYLNILVAVDARMGEVYWANYLRETQTGIVRLAGDEIVSKPDAVELTAVSTVECVGAGSGWHQYSDTLKQITGVKSLADIVYPKAASIAEIAAEQVLQDKTLTSVQAQPVYIRDKVANKPDA